MASWMLGYPETALMDAEQAPKDARELGHAAVLMSTLGSTPRLYMRPGNYAAASALVDELIALADEKGALFWKAQGMIDQGGLFLLTGKAADAVRTAYCCTNLPCSSDPQSNLIAHRPQRDRNFAP
jgi:hypothetical protein